VNGSNFMQGWVAFAGSLAMIALILTAFGLMLGIVKPADVLRRVAAILSIVVALMLAPGILAGIWSAMSFWQQIGLIAIGVGAFQWLRPQRRARKRNVE
jgi:hypothetical protein